MRKLFMSLSVLGGLLAFAGTSPASANAAAGLTKMNVQSAAPGVATEVRYRGRRWRHRGWRGRGLYFGFGVPYVGYGYYPRYRYNNYYAPSYYYGGYYGPRGYYRGRGYRYRNWRRGYRGVHRGYRGGHRAYRGGHRGYRGGHGRRR